MADPRGPLRNSELLKRLADRLYHRARMMDGDSDSDLDERASDRAAPLFAIVVEIEGLVEELKKEEEADNG